MSKKVRMNHLFKKCKSSTNIAKAHGLAQNTGLRRRMRIYSRRSSKRLPYPDFLN